jgi:hypothetical protein
MDLSICFLYYLHPYRLRVPGVTIHQFTTHYTHSIINHYVPPTKVLIEPNDIYPKLLKAMEELRIQPK